MHTKLWLSVVLTGAVFTGCGDDTTNTDEGDGGNVIIDSGAHDAGTIDSATHDAAAADAGGGHLQSGTYNVKNVVKISDGCGLALEATGADAFTTTQVLNTGTLLSIGKRYDNTTDPTWTPADYSQGSGPYTSGTTATLVVASHAVITDDGCEYDIVRTSQVTFTGNNALSIDFTDNETNQNTKCKKANSEPMATCTSHYTFDLSM